LPPQDGLTSFSITPSSAFVRLLIAPQHCAHWLIQKLFTVLLPDRDIYFRCEHVTVEFSSEPDTPKQPWI